MALYRTPVFFVLTYFGLCLASSEEHPGLLSRLYKQASKQNRTLIIVLDNSAHGDSKELHYKASLKADKTLSLPLMYMHHQDQHGKNSQPAKLPISKLLEKEDDKVEKSIVKKRVKQRHHHPKDFDDKRFLRSPVIKSLLRISNSLRCEAKDECEDKCNNRYSGKKRDECEDECEFKYTCEESEKDASPEKDECEEKHSCEQLEMSTKGERYVTIETKCKRC